MWSVDRLTRESRGRTGDAAGGSPCPALRRPDRRRGPLAGRTSRPSTTRRSPPPAPSGWRDPRASSRSAVESLQARLAAVVEGEDHLAEPLQGHRARQGEGPHAGRRAGERQGEAGEADRRSTPSSALGLEQLHEALRDHHRRPGSCSPGGCRASRSRRTPAARRRRGRAGAGRRTGPIAQVPTGWWSVSDDGPDQLAPLLRRLVRVREQRPAPSPMRAAPSGTAPGSVRRPRSRTSRSLRLVEVVQADPRAPPPGSAERSAPCPWTWASRRTRRGRTRPAASASARRSR